MQIDHSQAVEAAKAKMASGYESLHTALAKDDGATHCTCHTCVMARYILSLSAPPPAPPGDPVTAEKCREFVCRVADGFRSPQRIEGNRYVAMIDEFTAELLAMFAGGTGDDGEPVTEEWLRSIGFFKYGNGCEWIRDDFAGSLFDWLNGEPHTGISWKVGEYWPLENDLKTRGDVRRLCAALGIPTEPAK